MDYKKNILIDVDGVLANFDQTFINVAKNMFGINVVQHPDIWDFCEFPEIKPYKDQIMNDIIHIPGIVGNMEVYDGAKEMVQALRSKANVIACTDSAYPGIFATERVIWLMEEFNFKKEDIIFSGRKYLINARMLIDDKPSNVEKWVRHNPNGVGVLWHPATREYKLEVDKSLEYKILKTSDYQDILKFF